MTNTEAELLKQEMAALKAERARWEVAKFCDVVPLTVGMAWRRLPATVNEDLRQDVLGAIDDVIDAIQHEMTCAFKPGVAS